MSEIKLKDARYYDLISQEQLSPGKVIMLSIKNNSGTPMNAGLTWVKENLENINLAYGNVGDLETLSKTFVHTDKPIVVVVTGSSSMSYDLQHYAREHGVTLFCVVDAAACPRYQILLSNCTVELTYDKDNKVASAMAIRNRELATGWTIDFTGDK